MTTHERENGRRRIRGNEAERLTESDVMRILDTAGEAERCALLNEEDALKANARRRPRLLWLTAAGLFLAAGWGASQLYSSQERGDADDGPETIILGPGEIAATSPVGDVESFTSFRWDYELAPGSRFELSIWAVEDGVDAPPRILVETQTAGWSPTADELGKLGTRTRDIRWQVQVLDAFDELGAFFEVRARRSL